MPDNMEYQDHLLNDISIIGKNLKMDDKDILKGMVIAQQIRVANTKPRILAGAILWAIARHNKLNINLTDIGKACQTANVYVQYWTNDLTGSFYFSDSFRKKVRRML